MEKAVGSKIENFFRQYKRDAYKKGYVLLLADENPKYAYYLVSGRIKQYDITHSGTEIIVNIFKPGAYFMILTAITGLPNTHYYSAETDIIIYRAPIKYTTHFVNTNPDVMKHMLIQAYIGFDGVLKRITHLMSRNARGRVIYEILLDARGFGEVSQEAPYNLSINVTELSLRAGLSRETVSREVSRLRKAGYLALTQKITVLDPSLLNKALEDSF
ncbi:MAG: hypothetical protein JWP06_290 [Candidatus Saccharibacteria bacterium]|nr:hypothetical protein [Candidatus Saccharibacteria bacterium]